MNSFRAADREWLRPAPCGEEFSDGCCPSPDDVGRRAHRAGDQAAHALAGVDRALAGQPHVLAEVLLALGVVVVAVEIVGALDRRVPTCREAVDDAVHHLLAVEVGEPLRPPQRLHVAPELRLALDEVGEVGVGEADPAPAALLLRDLDVLHGELVADTARAGVQEQPDPVLLVEAHLDEVVARAERPELHAPVRRDRLGLVDAGSASSSAIRGCGRRE